MKEKAEIYYSSFFFKFSKRCMYVCVVPSEELIHIHAWQRSEVLCRRLSENSLRMLSREKDGLSIELSYFLRYRMFFQSLFVSIIGKLLETKG